MTKAQNDAVKRYFEKMGRINIRPSKELEAAIKTHAQERGESMQAFVIRAIQNEMKRDKGEPIVKVKEIYCREHIDSYAIVEDTEGNLFRWYLGTTRPLVPAPHESRAGLQTYDPNFREGMMKGLRALGYYE